MDPEKGKAVEGLHGAAETSPTFDFSELDEPKTMLHADIQHAREAALQIMNNFSHEEAAKIFLQGWKAAECGRKMDKTGNPN